MYDDGIATQESVGTRAWAPDVWVLVHERMVEVSVHIKR